MQHGKVNCTWLSYRLACRRVGTCILVPTLDVVVVTCNYDLCSTHGSNVFHDFPSLVSDMYDVTMDTLSNTL